VGRRPYPAGGSAALCLRRQYQGRQSGVRRPRAGPPRPRLRFWRYHTLRYRDAASTQRKKRARRGRPATGEASQDATRYCMRVDAEPLKRAAEEQGWTVLATTVGHRGVPMRSSSSVLGAEQRGGTGLALDQASGHHHPCVAGQTSTDCGVGDAHRRGVAGLRVDPASGAALLAEPAAVPAWQQGNDRHTDRCRSPLPICSSRHGAIGRGEQGDSNASLLPGDKHRNTVERSARRRARSDLEQQ
jgi:hypothetical protein